MWTRDHATALRMSRDLDFGCVWINTHIPLAAEMPHGGFGQSGYGKDLSGYGLEDYTRVKHVMSSPGLTAAVVEQTFGPAVGQISRYVDILAHAWGGPGSDRAARGRSPLGPAHPEQRRGG